MCAEFITKVYEMIDGKTLEQHKRAFVYLDSFVGGKDTKINFLTNLEIMKKMAKKCSEILNQGGTWVYNFPLTPQYDVYNGDKHCFEVYISPLENDIVMLTVNDIRFDSRNYDLNVTNTLQKLWVNAKEKNAMVAQNMSNETQR